MKTKSSVLDSLVYGLIVVCTLGVALVLRVIISQAIRCALEE